MENWETALHHTLLSLGDAQFKGMLGRASEQELEVLHVLASDNEVLGPRALENRCPAIKSAAEVLKRLTAKGLAERVRRGEYLISDRLFSEYIKRQGAIYHRNHNNEFSACRHNGTHNEVKHTGDARKMILGKRIGVDLTA